MTCSIRTLLGATAMTLALGGLAACGQREEAEVPAATATTDTNTTTTAADSMAAPATAATDGVVTVGGAPMLPTRTIVENASAAPNLSTLVAAVTAADLGGTLSGTGPFTVFAPTNAAFEKLPAGTVDTLVKPESKAALTSILTYHVVPGTLTAAQLTDGQKLTTVNGATLTVSKTADGVTLTDAKGGKSMVTQADVMQSNGVVHVVDTVVQPS